MSKRKTNSTILTDVTKRTRTEDVESTVADSMDSYASYQARYNLVKDALINANFADAINHANSGLKDIIEQHVSFLDLRAEAFGLMADFKSALRDVDLMLQLAPSVPTGYIRAGNLHLMRGKYIQAMQSYENGLQNVSDDNHRLMLTHYRDSARSKSQMRFDIVGQLPNELVDIILKDVDFKQLMILLDVSKSWREKITGCPSAWSNIKISRNISARELQFLKRVNNHITNLQLWHLKDASLCRAILLQMANKEFTALQKFCIYQASVPRTQELFGAIAATANTLDHLEIHIKEGCPIVPLKTLLTTCPNLDTLVYHNISKSLKETSGYWDPTFVFKLTKLKLYFKTILIMDLKQVILRCPELRQLTIRGCATARIDDISRCCKKLKTFSFNHIVFDEEDVYDGDDDAYPDLRNVTLCIDNPRNFTTFFTNNCTTIRSLRFERASTIDLDGLFRPLDNPREWQSLMNACEFRNLQSLALATDHELSTIVAPFLQEKTPNLRSLSFDKTSVLEGTEIATAIASLRCLQRLRLTQVRSNNRTMQALFRSLAARSKKESTLKGVYIGYNEGFSIDGIIDYLTDISSLQRTDFEDVRGLEREGLIRLCEKLRFHPCIQTLKMAQLICLNDTMIDHLAAIKNLKYLYLFEVHLTKHGLQKLIDSGVKIIEYIP